jgi:ribosomal protein S27E
MEKAGQKIKCRLCGEETIIYLADSRYRVFCVSCGEDTYLKTYNGPQRAEIAPREAMKEQNNGFRRISV